MYLTEFILFERIMKNVVLKSRRESVSAAIELILF